MMIWVMLRGVSPSAALPGRKSGIAIGIGLKSPPGLIVSCVCVKAGRHASAAADAATPSPSAWRRVRCRSEPEANLVTACRIPRSASVLDHSRIEIRFNGFPDVKSCDRKELVWRTRPYRTQRSFGRNLVSRIRAALDRGDGRFGRQRTILVELHGDPEMGIVRFIIEDAGWQLLAKASNKSLCQRVLPAHVER